MYHTLTRKRTIEALTWIGVVDLFRVLMDHEWRVDWRVVSVCVLVTGKQKQLDLTRIGRTHDQGTCRRRPPVLQRYTGDVLAPVRLITWHIHSCSLLSCTQRPITTRSDEQCLIVIFLSPELSGEFARAADEHGLVTLEFDFRSSHHNWLRFWNGIIGSSHNFTVGSSPTVMRSCDRRRRICGFS